MSLLLLLFLCCSGTKNWSGGGSRLLYCSTPASLDLYSNWIFRFTLIQLYYFRHGCPSFNEKETAAHSHQHRNNPPGPALARWLTESTTTLSTWLISSSQHSSALRISIAGQVCRRQTVIQSILRRLLDGAVGCTCARVESELWRMRSVIHYWHWKTDDEMIKRLNWYARWFFLGLVDGPTTVPVRM